MDKDYIKQLLYKAFHKGEQVGIFGESEYPSDHRFASKLEDQFKEWVIEEIDGLDYL